MARLISAFLNRGDAPARDALQQSFKRLGFRLAVDASYVPGESSAYLPCTLDGEDAGFQITFADVAAGRAHLDGQDCMIKLRWGGDPREEVAALMFAAALAADYGAVVLEDGAEGVSPSDALLEKAKRAFTDLGG